MAALFFCRQHEMSGEYFHLQNLLMFFIGQNSSALALCCSRNVDVASSSLRRLLNPVAQPCSS